MPLVWLAGGPLEYLKDGLSLLGFVGSKTSVLAGGLNAVLNNLAQVGGGLLVGLNLGVVLFGLAFVRRASLQRRLSRRHWAVLSLWAGPALAVFVLGHIGQVGYLLLILPAACLVLALYVEAAGRGIAPVLRLSTGRATALVAGVLATAHVATVLVAPSTAHALLRDPVAASMVDVRDNDRFWTEVPPFLDRFTPQEAIVLAEASPWGSFRHAGYYLTKYRVYGLGNDRFGHFGWLYESYGGLTDYSLEGRARRLMPRPTAARYAIILDPKIVRTIVQEVPDHRGAGDRLPLDLGGGPGRRGRADVRVRADVPARRHAADALRHPLDDPRPARRPGPLTRPLPSPPPSGTLRSPCADVLRGVGR